EKDRNNHEQDTRRQMSSHLRPHWRRRNVFSPGLELQSSVEPAVASSRPLSCGHSSVFVCRSSGNGDMASLATVKRAGGRIHGGISAVARLLDAILLCAASAAAIILLGGHTWTPTSPVRCSGLSESDGCCRICHPYGDRMGPGSLHCAALIR